jgi:hypothetical protein
MNKPELVKRIKDLKKKIKSIEDKVDIKVSEDIDSYELQSDLGRRRIDKLKLKDLLNVRAEYRSELVLLEGQLQQIEAKGAKNILMRFDRP